MTSTTTAGLTVADVMRPPVTTVERDAHVAAAAYLMKKKHDNALVVVTDGVDCRPVTLICDGDITQAVADGRDLEKTRLTSLQLPELVVVSPDTSIPDATERMLATRVAYAPVVDDGRMVGLIDLALLCRALLTERRAADAGG
ncbi:CBS domain-containing protein [Blastococcus sp. CCUG 61487]|uniref:CBS domain-containing protein n=1 Tax=Blastococcus sp. CCUG 61487 TaxID=1840703 RepID=UPI0010BFA690|nr:CBS domain-containing protein [Blastococcus sp. CCUG 61487]TKJ16581.1 hypothetical protein A6V29_13695 [Blastococcus sp. CCUG 61487]